MRVAFAKRSRAYLSCLFLEDDGSEFHSFRDRHLKIENVIKRACAEAGASRRQIDQLRIEMRINRAIKW